METSIDIVELAMKYGAKDPEDPLCVFQPDRGTFAYLTREIFTKYYRYVTQ